MRINEVCKQCKLTKKAIAYYEDHQLISPKVLENGYRDFSEEDIKRLKKVATLRQLGFSVGDVQKILTDESGTALDQLAQQQKLTLEGLKEKQKLIETLLQNGDWNYINEQLSVIEQRQSVMQRLLSAFPGMYGRYLAWHFGSFLNEAADTQERNEAFESIIAFLDSVQFAIPDDLQAYLDRVTGNFDAKLFKEVYKNRAEAIQDTAKYIEENQQSIASYLAYKQSEDFKNSMAYRLRKVLEQFMHDSGYYAVFIPAMKKISQSYREYCESMEKANNYFLDTHSDFSEKNNELEDYVSTEFSGSKE